MCSWTCLVQFKFKIQQLNDQQQNAAVFVRPRSGTSTGPALVPNLQSTSSCCDVGGCWDWGTPSNARPWADAASFSTLASQSDGATGQPSGGPDDPPVSAEGVLSKGMGPVDAPRDQPAISNARRLLADACVCLSQDSWEEPADDEPMASETQPQSGGSGARTELAASPSCPL